jgi:hypothetical protein
MKINFSFIWAIFTDSMIYLIIRDLTLTESRIKNRLFALSLCGTGNVATKPCFQSQYDGHNILKIYRDRYNYE